MTRSRQAHRLLSIANLGLCAFLLAPTWSAAAEVPGDDAGALAAKHIAAVEGGLRPANSIVGEATWSLSERMEHYGVPGVGIAVIEGGEVAWFRVYGLADRETGEAATTSTLFQAGSVSKPVAAFGAMRMVEAGKLSLDEPVNDKLVSWKIPDNEFTARQAVTLSQLLSHTAGTTVHGFPGYEPGQPVPTLVQVLDGVDPANTDPIRVDKLPGESWRYSGGGYTVAQQLMIDVSGRPFPELMQELVLGPLGMSASTYANPLPPERLRFAAAGVLPEGDAVRGKRHVYPEMAAAGLWTTAGDLARFAVGVQHALAGESELLSREMAEKMVEPVVPDFGRGFALRRREGHLYFTHAGWDEGFCALLVASRETGQGVVVTINSNHPNLMNEVERAIAFEYGWPGYREHRALPLSEETISTFAGRYRYNGELAFRLYGDGGRLYMQYVGSAAEELLRVGENRYLRRERPTPIELTIEDGVPTFAFVPDDGEREPHSRLADGEKTARELLAEGDVKGALAAYRALKDAGEEAGSESYLNNVGLDLARNDDHALGIALLAMNCELYPESANTWDSLGLAYRSAGQRELALVHYRKALEVDPKFPSALAAVAELSGPE